METDKIETQWRALSAPKYCVGAVKEYMFSWLFCITKDYKRIELQCHTFVYCLQRVNHSTMEATCGCLKWSWRSQDKSRWIGLHRSYLPVLCTMIWLWNTLLPPRFYSYGRFSQFNHGCWEVQWVIITLVIGSGQSINRVWLLMCLCHFDASCLRVNSSIVIPCYVVEGEGITQANYSND